MVGWTGARLILAVMRRGGPVGLRRPTLVAPVGRHPLMAADKRGSFSSHRGESWQDTQSVQMGSHLPPHQIPTCGSNVHNEVSGLHLPPRQIKMRRLLLQKCSLIGRQLRRDPPLTFRVCLMARDGKVRFQMSGVELNSRDAARGRERRGSTNGKEKQASGNGKTEIKTLTITIRRRDRYKEFPSLLLPFSLSVYLYFS